MPSILPPLAQSESKKRFLERLQLNESNPEDKRLYAMMKAEAIEARSRIASSPGALIPSLRNDASVQPPYSNAQISETATHSEIIRIYQLARPETRRYYDLGRDVDRLHEDNWIIRWMLWHVNRYRDHRNKNRAAPTRAHSRPNQNQSSGTEDGTPSHSRDGSPSSQRRPSGVPGLSGADAPSRQRSRYWDPVRDS